MSRSRLAPVLLLAVLGLTACGSDEPVVPGSGSGPLAVTAAFYPYAFLAERIGGEDAEVTSLTRPGAEPHDLELTPQQVGGLGAADLVLYAGGFQPAVDDAVEQQAADRAFDVNEAVSLADGAKVADPHVWLDPVRYAQIGRAIADRFAELRPDLADGYTERGRALTLELTALDAELRTGLRSCARKEVVTSHDAFGYLTERYGLEQIAVTGLVPEQEPTPRRLAEVAQLAKDKGVTTVFFEELVSPQTAESLAREIGARAEVLSPLEGPPESGDYFTAMRANLATLQAALDCE